MKKYNLIMWLAVVCGLSNAYGQHKLSGRVLSQHGTALAGVSISTAEKHQLEYTDSLGYFELTSYSPNPTFTFSLLGYERKQILVELPVKSPINVVMQASNQMLEEVEVSSGYQVIPKERATGSFSHINSKTFNEQVSTDIMSRLEAIGASIRVDRTTITGDNNISVRGLSTISGPEEVLVVVDNFPYEGDLNNLNPNDVADVTILRDAAAASIWGARAGNGVIVITVLLFLSVGMTS